MPQWLKIKKRETKELLDNFDNRRVLIVEDTIISGSSIKFLCDILIKKGIPFDVVSVSGDIKYANETKENLGAERVIIASGRQTNIYRRHDLSGVIKDEKELHAQRYKKQTDDVLSQDQETVNKVRKDANVIVDHLVDWYESGKGE
jgi:orotate phosphoribosyltransferase